MLDLARQDRARGALLGAVIGDAFGAPLEGASASSAIALAEKRAQNPRKWGYTDDGSMFIATAESIRETGSVSPEGLLRAFARRYEPARGFGRGMKLAIQAYEAGTHWKDVSQVAWPEGSRGNGGAVRVGALALRRWVTTAHLLAAATVATSVTHAHHEAIEAALLQAGFVGLTLEEPDLLASPAKAIDRVESEVPRTPFVAEVLEKLRESLARRSGTVETVFGTSTLARESVPAAIEVFLRSHETYEETVIAAASLGGDVDSICAMVGCLAGALHGLSGIPARWVEAIGHESPSPAAMSLLADDLCGLPPAEFAETSG